MLSCYGNQSLLSAIYCCHLYNPYPWIKHTHSQLKTIYCFIQTVFFCYFFQHISWLRYPCPNHHAAGDGTLIADGTVVFNASLYGVRITGENGVFLSELRILQNSLHPDVAGLYLCEAWPHNANKDISSHQTSSRYHDEFIIGGHSMVKSCFYDLHRDKYYYQHYGPSSHNYKLQKRYRTPRNKIVPDVSINMPDSYSEINKTDVS